MSARGAGLPAAHLYEVHQRTSTLPVLLRIVGALGYRGDMNVGVATAERDTMVTALDTDLAQVIESEPANRLGLMLYGSVARGTADGGSDIDVLELVTSPALSYRVGDVNVTQYEVPHLRSLAQQGSLFVLHLRSEGLVLQDPHGSLRRALDAYVPPDSYQHIWRQLQIVSAVVDPRAEDAALYIASIARVGIYLLRTAVYIRAIELGENTFDLGSIGWVSQRPSLCRALALRRKRTFTYADLELLREQLAVVIPEIRTNEYTTIEAFAVANSSRPDLAALLTTVLQRENCVDYSALTLPPF